MYYVSMALQYTGKSLTQSIATAGSIFKDYPAPTSGLVRGYLDPGFAPLIYPRQVLTQILSWGYRIFGSAGFGISTLVIGLTSIALIVRWCWREWGNDAAWIAAIFCLGSTMFFWYGTGLFIEAPLMLIEVVWLYSLPISRHYVAHKYWDYLTAILIIAMGFTRQSPLLPLAILWGGYLAEFLQRKKIKNSWFTITWTGSLAAIATYFVVDIWAPYSPIGLSQKRHPSIVAGMKYVGDLIYRDPIMVAALIIAIFSVRKIKNKTSKTLAGISLGVFLSCAINIYLATGEYRYWSPLFVPVVLLASSALAHSLKRSSSDRAARDEDSRQTQPIKPYLALYLTIAICLMVALSSVLFYGKADGKLLNSVSVSQFYPGSKISGNIGCYGPWDRIYLVVNDKKVAALDGSAMAAHPGIANTLAGKYHSLEYGNLGTFITECMAHSGA